MSELLSAEMERARRLALIEALEQEQIKEASSAGMLLDFTEPRCPHEEKVKSYRKYLKNLFPYVEFSFEKGQDENVGDKDNSIDDFLETFKRMNESGKLAAYAEEDSKLVSNFVSGKNK